jgi:hypothetical protein
MRVSAGGGRWRRHELPREIRRETRSERNGGARVRGASLSCITTLQLSAFFSFIIAAKFCNVFGAHIRETLCMAPRMIATSRPASVCWADADTNNALLACVDKHGMAGVRTRHTCITATHTATLQVTALLQPARSCAALHACRCMHVRDTLVDYWPHISPGLARGEGEKFWGLLGVFVF